MIVLIAICDITNAYLDFLYNFSALLLCCHNFTVNLVFVQLLLRCHHSQSFVPKNMSETKPENKSIEFDPILPDQGVLFYEECPAEYEIERPRLLPLKSTTQIRFEQLQHEAARVWREKQKTAKKN